MALGNVSLGVGVGIGGGGNNVAAGLGIGFGGRGGTNVAAGVAIGSGQGGTSVGAGVAIGGGNVAAGVGIDIGGAQQGGAVGGAVTFAQDRGTGLLEAPPFEQIDPGVNFDEVNLIDPNFNDPVGGGGFDPNFNDPVGGAGPAGGGEAGIRGAHKGAAQATGDWTNKIADKIQEALNAPPDKQPALLAELQEMQHNRANAEKLMELAEKVDEEQTDDQ